MLLSICYIFFFKLLTIFTTERLIITMPWLFKIAPPVVIKNLVNTFGNANNPMSMLMWDFMKQVHTCIFFPKPLTIFTTKRFNTTMNIYNFCPGCFNKFLDHHIGNINNPIDIFVGAILWKRWILAASLLSNFLS